MTPINIYGASQCFGTAIVDFRIPFSMFGAPQLLRDSHNLISGNFKCLHNCFWTFIIRFKDIPLIFLNCVDNHVEGVRPLLIPPLLVLIWTCVLPLFYDIA